MLTVNNTVTFPSAWYEVTFAQFLAITALPPGAGPDEVLTVLASDKDKFLDLPDSEAGTIILNRLAFLRELPTFGEAPDRVLIGNHWIDVPKRIDLCTYRQKLFIDMHVNKLRSSEVDADLHNLAKVLLTVYLCPAYQGAPITDMAQAHAIGPLVDKMPCTVAMPVAGFFLSRYFSKASSGGLTLKETKTPMPNLRLTWFQKLKRTVSTARWMPSRKVVT